MTYAADTDVSPDRSRAEIEKTLRRYGANAFMYGWEGARAMIGFQVQGRRYRIALPLPPRDSPEFALTTARRQRRSSAATEAAWEQATRQRWRALALWIKAVLEAAEAGITSIEEALQPFVMLPGGQTVGEWMAPQIEAAYRTGRMPPMLPMLPAPREEAKEDA